MKEKPPQSVPTPNPVDVEFTLTQTNKASSEDVLMNVALIDSWIPT